MADIGLIGLGTMGRALALNIAEHGFNIAVFNRTASVTKEFVENAGALGEKITGAEDLQVFVSSLKAPRAILLMIPAGAPVDQQIQALLPLLDEDDLIIDGGNANFNDTIRRISELDQPFLGMGVSGGEDGARFGPSLMGGGSRKYWDRIAPIMEAISAKYEDTPCADWMGEEGAGHFVKMVHNGIEYADMQLIAEVYGVMRDGLGMEASEIGAQFKAWNEGLLKSYLIEITGEVASAIDPKTSLPILDVIVDAAGQKGTGRWTVIEAHKMGAAVPAIDASVVARNLSSRRKTRTVMEEIYGAAPQRIEREVRIEILERALICGKILAYDQGFAMIHEAREELGWSMHAPTIARVWREGCIIRSAMLNDMAAAFEDDPDRQLMAAPYFADHIKRTHEALREVVALGAQHGLVMPALSSALAYFDAMRTGRGTANMLQGLRDYFGRHGFERLDDGKTDQHGPWAG